MTFTRVKSSNPEDPQHEFDAPTRLVEKYPDRYAVVDPEPVDAARPPKPVGKRSLTPDDSWKLADLKAYADAHQIDLGDASKKADILAAIEA